jgi:hypothetical protein
MGNRYVGKVFNNKIKTGKFYCIPGIFKRNEQTVQGTVNFFVVKRLRMTVTNNTT